MAKGGGASQAEAISGKMGVHTRGTASEACENKAIRQRREESAEGGSAKPHWGQRGGELPDVAAAGNAGCTESARRERESLVYQHIAKYAKPDDWTACWVTAQTLIIYWGLFWAACAYRGPLERLVCGTLIVVCGLTRTRVFCLMHDMAHQSFWSSRAANVVGATLLGSMVYTPYSGWKHGHDYHHRHSNNTDRKQNAQTAPLTVRQYEAMPLWRRAAYCAVYGHWSLLTTTPFFYFVVVQRFLSTWYENLLILLYWGCVFGSGSTRLVTVDLLSAAVGASMGFFLFHIQHTFEGAYKASSKDYSRFDNGMWGSSNLLVPPWLAFFTASIQYHNVHHLNTRVPLYRLRQCFEDGGALFEGVPTFTMTDALMRLPYSLRNDEDLSFTSCYDVFAKGDPTAEGRACGVGGS